MSVGYGQESDPGERLLEEDRLRRQTEALTRTDAGQRIEAPAPAGVVTESPCFMIDEIHLLGVEILDSSDFDSILEEFESNCLGEVSIGNLLTRLSGVYAERGYITTRAYIPAQDIRAGVLRIDVVEGRIEAFVYRQFDESGEPLVGKPRKILSAFPIRSGDVFQLRDIEHGLEQMNRLGSSRASANIIAGEAPGTSRVVVTEQKFDEYRGIVGYDNRGDEPTGKTRLRANLEFDDILDLNDSYLLSFSGSEDSNALAGSFGFPWGRWLFSLDGSYSESLSPVTSTTNLLTQTGSVSLTSERLLYRDATSRYSGYVTANKYTNRRHINIVELTPQDRSSLRFGLRHQHRSPTSIILTDSFLTIGSRFFGGDWDPDVIIRGAPRADFQKVSSRVTYIRPFTSGAQFRTTIVGQWSDVPLYLNEQMTIGGWESVRGYSGFSVSGDRGIYARSSFNFPPVSLGLSSGISSADIVADTDTDTATNTTDSPSKKIDSLRGGYSPFVFFDSGHVTNRALGDSSSLLSVGAGLSSSLGRFSFSGELAVPLRSFGERRLGDIEGFVSVSLKIF